MSKPIRISLQTRKNWLIDAVVFLGGVLAASQASPAELAADT